MPERKNPAVDLPDDSAIRKLFPKAVVDKAKEVAHEKDGPKKPAKPKPSK